MDAMPCHANGCHAAGLAANECTYSETAALGGYEGFFSFTFEQVGVSR